jgi:UDP-GlcNAc:undecaprenyl-phosphate/decaprenyl-phosphate GlcNAc-1-phosphate transferase
MLNLEINLQMLLGLIAALGVSYFMIPPVVKICRAKNMVAMPNGRTSHNGAVPTVGGVAIFASTMIGTSLFMPKQLPSEMQFLVPAVIILFFIGLQDDMVGIKAWKKLIGQIIVSLIVIVAADVRMTTLHGLFGIFEINIVISYLISLVLFIGIINAFNLIDGIDGLASGLGIAIALVFGIWLSMLGKPHFAVLAWSLAGGLMAFYYFNVFSKKYKLFMGDTGSMLIGFIFATLVVKILCCTVEPGSFMYMKAFPVVAISLMILPIADTLRVMSMRILRGHSPFYADRTHCHHDLLRFGYNHLIASSLMVAANLTLFFIAYALKDLPAFMLGMIMLGAGVFICDVPRLVLKYILKRVEEPSAHYQNV